MPVTLNEPLNMLQRLCEELEYSELLEKAATIVDTCDRLVYVAAFAVSAYGSACHRAGRRKWPEMFICPHFVAFRSQALQSAARRNVRMHS